MRVAVVTPYHAEPEEQLAECRRSVQQQTHPCTHFLVADGAPSPVVAAPGEQHIALPRPHADHGDTPRAIGSLSAIAQGFEAVTYLDADNWYSPEHIKCMVDLHLATRAAVCVASRSLHRLDGSLLSAAGEPEEGVSYVDTNCLFFTQDAYRLIPLWALLPPRLHAIGDRVIWAAIKAFRVRVARRKSPTVSYRTAFRVHYEERGEEPPPDAKSNTHVLEAFAWWRALPEPERQLVLARLGFRF